MENLRTLILAAGKGARMKSRKAKVLHKVGGATLIEHVVRASRHVSTEIFVVVGNQAEKVKSVLPELNFIDQEEQLGTGHAVMCARDVFRGFTGEVLVLPGDVPLIRPATLEGFLQFHREGGFLASVLTAEVANPEGYGRLVRRSNNEVDCIVEHRDASSDVLKISEINSSIYMFHAPSLFEALTHIRTENAQAEYYLTDVIGIFVQERPPVGAYRIENPGEILGVNTRRELADIDHRMRRGKCEELMAEGVTIVDPASTFIDADVEIGADTVIHPSVQIQGRTIIGDDVTVHSFTRISNCRIADRAIVLEGCILVDSELGEDVSLGPYAHLRPGTSLAEKVKVGNFVEIKKSSLGKGSKAMHLSYLGDATIGEHVNIGAGTITCNYDGVGKYPTVIEDDVFIGSDSQLIAPVTIGKGAYVGAGSSITESVPPEALAIARGRQTVKEGWAGKRKKK